MTTPNYKKENSMETNEERANNALKYILDRIKSGPVNSYEVSKLFSVPGYVLSSRIRAFSADKIEVVHTDALNPDAGYIFKLKQ